MGPTGVHAKIPSEHETVLILGNQSSFSFLRSYGPAMRAAGNRVLYVGHFNNKDEVYCQEELENATDVIVWLNANGDMIPANRSNDESALANDMIPALVAYEQGKL